MEAHTGFIARMALARLGWPAEVPALRLWPIDARAYMRPGRPPRWQPTGRALSVKVLVGTFSYWLSVPLRAALLFA